MNVRGGGRFHGDEPSAARARFNSSTDGDGARGLNSFDLSEDFGGNEREGGATFIKAQGERGATITGL